MVKERGSLLLDPADSLYLAFMISQKIFRSLETCPLLATVPRSSETKTTSGNIFRCIKNADCNNCNTGLESWWGVGVISGTIYCTSRGDPLRGPTLFYCNATYCLLRTGYRVARTKGNNRGWCPVLPSVAVVAVSIFYTSEDVSGGRLCF